MIKALYGFKDVRVEYDIGIERIEEHGQRLSEEPQKRGPLPGLGRRVVKYLHPTR